MPGSEKKTLTGLAVSRAMRRQVIRLDQDASIAGGINALTKYKVNGLLATDREERPSGVLSKTDIMGAYYAGFPLDTPIKDIMSSPPLFCSYQDAIDKALDTMRSMGIYRLYVLEKGGDRVIGSLAYPDIVGLLYQYCHNCEYGHVRTKNSPARKEVQRILVKEIMTREIKSVIKGLPISRAIEELSFYRFGAILIIDKDKTPCGVISKTDLTLAYRRGTDPGEPVQAIMSSPVQTCGSDQLLEDAIRIMIFSDIHRLFVQESGTKDLTGVISLSDAARIRSGSCHACISARIKIETP
ncbi:CBS domain-containing protein [Desulfospira joergensenii]|uniref:CBS domain-containing protein n=1 Tax=Desulfospira joergensenii TaxID=53329 RepID=UPI0003B51774|nr:CBS domain-containing protein [Desulfospira joergensenii]